MKRDQFHVMILGGNFIGKGAEAMMLTMRDALKKAFPDIVCCVTPLDDKEERLLKANNILPIKCSHPRLADMIVNFILELMHITPRKKITSDTVCENGIINVFRATDIVVDIAGFVSGDQIGARRSFRRWLTYRRALYARNRYLFMPQSWGPFENIRVRIFTRSITKAAEIVFAREQESYNHLHNCNCFEPHKLFLAPDIAFQFHLKSTEPGKKLLEKIGLNNFSTPFIVITPNVRIYERLEGKVLENIYSRALLDIIEYFTENTSCNIVLVPHEASFWGDSDLELCNMLFDLVSDKKNRLFVLPSDASAEEVKAIISLSSFVIASRYHSLVAALSTRTPVTVIGWSHKYDGLMQCAGLEKWAIDPVRGSAGDMVKITTNGWEHRDSIHEILEKNVPSIEDKSAFALDKMIEIIRQIKDKA